MAYRLKRKEPIPDGIRRIVNEELDSAAAQLSSNKNRDEAIHEARKSVKKIRGALRLVQSDLGPTYQIENRRLRDLGRQLSQFRDAAAIIETFDGVLEKYKDGLQENTLASIREGLNKSKGETEEAARIDETVKTAIAAFRAAKRRVRTWPLKSDGFTAIAPGLEKRFRGGRDAMIVVQDDPRPENYHEWRKRVKDHWYHVRLLEDLWSGVMQAHEASLKSLETWLGDDHNLFVLQEKLEHEPDKYGNQETIQLFLTLAAQHQKELRENAMSLGERIYEEKPRRFRKNMAKVWHTWQQDPESMKQEQKEERQVSKKAVQAATSAGSKRARRTAA